MMDKFYTVKITKTLLIIALWMMTPLVSYSQGQVGTIAPNFKAQTLRGDWWKLSQFYEVKPVIAVFWNSWNPYLSREMVHLQNIAQQLSERIAIVAIANGRADTLQRTHAFQQRYHMDFPVIYDIGGKITGQYQIRQSPTFLILGTDGIVRYRGDSVPSLNEIHTHWRLLTQTKHPAHYPQ